MQSNDENPRAAGRPSLLTPAQQAEADRHRILNHLEHPSGAEAGSRRQRGKVLWGGGLGLGALLIAAGAWFSAGDGDIERQQADGAAIRLAVAAPAAKPDVPESTAAATIHDEDPLAGLQGGDAPAEKQPSLKDMLNAQPASQPQSENDVLGKALAQAAPKQAATAKSAPKLVKAATKPKPPPQVEAEPDNDVTLLAALVAHAQVNPEPEPPAKPVKKTVKPATTQAKLNQCKKLRKDDAQKCRVRVCSGRAKNDPACKAAPASAKVATQS
ncbi:hypothetical protein [Janthinobacterium agaricidamnosum]|uniref:Transmembrane protein n=1 Tax=Janthinobacterium agaricidamnosum NBRC 102515 = DSM 9628 TaxID=1349767 RepID=W0V748_9BURK|nr:hypothetical protein [Janthinobacterium agaricidamnosum]CDG83173.1 hypothetical protein GJA_2542 [Janthinobacterium agaricidamnosum NBRC 102515 = DSM 9628]